MAEENVKKSFFRKIPGFRTGTPWKMAIASIIYLFILIMIIGIATSVDNTTTSTKAKKASPSFDWAKADITEPNIKSAMQNIKVHPISEDTDFPKDITKIEIADNAIKPGQKNIQIRFKPGTTWDETDFVKRVGGTAIAASSKLFSNPKIEEITLFAQTEMQDQYGKSQVEDVVKLTLNREIAQKADWKGLSERHLTNPSNIYAIAANYYIHPGMYKNLKDDLKSNLFISK